MKRFNKPTNPKFKDLTGRVFGSVTIDSFAYIENERTYWNCHCACGKVYVNNGDGFKNKGVTHCGCEKTGNVVHGLYYHPLYGVRRAMLNRCYNPKDQRYGTYGARGITVCDEWRNSPVAFIKWGTENGWKKGLTIDRKEINGNYEPTNCRWITKSENSQTTTRTIFSLLKARVSRKLYHNHKWSTQRIAQFFATPEKIVIRAIKNETFKSKDNVVEQERQRILSESEPQFA